MEIYSLTRRGRQLSHNVRYEDTARWRVIFYLAKYHSRSKEQILGEVAGATSDTLIYLKRKKIIVEGMGVDV